MKLFDREENFYYVVKIESTVKPPASGAPTNLTDARHDAILWAAVEIERLRERCRIKRRECVESRKAAETVGEKLH